MEETKKGLRCLAFARSATGNESDIHRQIAEIKDFVGKQGMTFVGSIVSIGSGVRMEDRVSEILARKRCADDFDVLVMTDYSRLMRFGSLRDMESRHLLLQNGIRSMSVGDGGEMSNFNETMMLLSARFHAQQISKRVTVGRIASLRDGRRCHLTHVPFGIDLLVRDEKDRSMYVIRNRPDGTQATIDANGAVTRVFSPPIKCRKHPLERVTLTPGDPEAVKVVRSIFERRFREGWTAKKIAEALHCEGCDVLLGKHWNADKVRAVVRNPVYLGIGIANSFMKLRDFVPIKSCPTQRQRPIDQWLICRYPLLRGVFVNPDLAQRVIAMHKSFGLSLGQCDA